MGLCQQLCSLYRLAAAERGLPAQYPRHSEATLLFREEEEVEVAATAADRTRSSMRCANRDCVSSPWSWRPGMSDVGAPVSLDGEPNRA